MEYICEYCHEPFTKINGKGRFCGLGCYHKSLNKLIYEPKNCLYCGNIFISKEKSTKQIKLNKYCSRDCHYKHQSELQKTGIIKQCLECGKEFYCKKCNISLQFFCSKKCGYDNKRGKPNSKASDIMSELIASGKHNPKRNYYKQGYIINNSTGEMEYYGSSYEQRRMIELNKLGMKWTKKHKIRIKYIDHQGVTRNYVPDILVENRYLEEIKPYVLVNSGVDNNDMKMIAGNNYCKENGLEYRIITERELSELSTD